VSNTRRRMRFTPTAQRAPYVPPININLNFKELVPQGNVNPNRIHSSYSDVDERSTKYNVNYNDNSFNKNQVPRGSFENEDLKRQNTEVTLKLALSELLKMLESKDRERTNDYNIPELIKASQRLNYKSNTTNLAATQYDCEMKEVPDLVGGINELKVHPATTDMSMQMRYA
jgi:hypothetical protein